MTDDTLPRQVREHFAEVVESEAAPSFQAMMDSAEMQANDRRHKRRQMSMRGGVFAGALAAAALVFIGLSNSPGEPRSERDGEIDMLVAQLTSSTQWQAPSDRFLSVSTQPDYMGLPDLQPDFDRLNEVKLWL